jgi:hypothetical protein
MEESNIGESLILFDQEKAIDRIKTNYIPKITREIWFWNTIY